MVQNKETELKESQSAQQVLSEYRKVDEQISTDMEKDHRTCISQKHRRESLKRASSLISISSKIAITQSNGGRLKNYFK